MRDPLLQLASQLAERGAYDSAIEWVCADQRGLQGELGRVRLDYAAVLLAGLGRYRCAVHAAELAVACGNVRAPLASAASWALLRIGKVEGAHRWAQRMAALSPENAQRASAPLAVSLYRDCISAAEVHAAHQEWSRRFVSLAADADWTGRDASPTRPLRIGYVSADFRRHPAASYVYPLLACHKRSKFEIYGYARVLERDEYTKVAQIRCDHWHEITELSDEQAAAQIRKDEIDLLVDITGHFGGSRLGIFALRPAPVQVSFPVYPASTSLSSIGYRITDAFVDPPGLTEALHSEELVRLPRCFACFENFDTPPEPGAPPFERNGVITFGAFHAAAKVNEAVVSLWAEVLKRVPDSHLILHNLVGDHPIVPREIYEPLLKRFAQQGVEARRLRFVPGCGTADHLRTIAMADIALDAFPRNGMTTTYESLLMGVPVVAKTGDCHQSRVSLSFLRAVGLDDLAAKDDACYVETAVRLAGNRKRLRRLRGSLRNLVERSELMDHTGFARAVEEAYRSMWIRWCKQGADR